MKKRSGRVGYRDPVRPWWYHTQYLDDYDDDDDDDDDGDDDDDDGDDGDDGNNDDDDAAEVSHLDVDQLSGLLPARPRPPFKTIIMINVGYRHNINEGPLLE